jgi:hypothetical protein
MAARCPNFLLNGDRWTRVGTEFFAMKVADHDSIMHHGGMTLMA